MIVANHSPRLKNAEDEVFEDITESSLNLNIKGDISAIKENESFNYSTASSIESVSEHFKQLYEQLEAFTETAKPMDRIFVRRGMNQLKNGMESINIIFDDLVAIGSRLEKFLFSRQQQSMQF